MSQTYYTNVRHKRTTQTCDTNVLHKRTTQTYDTNVLHKRATQTYDTNVRHKRTTQTMSCNVLGSVETFDSFIVRVVCVLFHYYIYTHANHIDYVFHDTGQHSKFLNSNDQ